MNRLSAPTHRAKAHAFLAGVLDNPSIRVAPATPAWFRAGVALHAQREDKWWSLTDCISFVVMREANATEALTHDQHFEQAGFKALLRHPPSVQ